MVVSGANQRVTLIPPTQECKDLLDISTRHHLDTGILRVIAWVVIPVAQNTGSTRGIRGLLTITEKHG